MKKPVRPPLAHELPQIVKSHRAYKSILNWLKDHDFKKDMFKTSWVLHGGEQYENPDWAALGKIYPGMVQQYEHTLVFRVELKSTRIMVTIMEQSPKDRHKKLEKYHDVITIPNTTQLDNAFKVWTELTNKYKSKRRTKAFDL